MTNYLAKYISSTTGRTVEIHFSTDGDPRAWVFANRPAARLISVFPWGDQVTPESKIVMLWSN